MSKAYKCTVCGHYTTEYTYRFNTTEVICLMCLTKKIQAADYKAKLAARGLQK